MPDGVVGPHNEQVGKYGCQPPAPSLLTLRSEVSAIDAEARVARARQDRGSQFIDGFDEVFRTEGLKILKTPVRTPVANSFAERWIGSIRRELLDRTIIWNQHQVEQLVVDYIEHYNDHRTHRSLDQRPLLPPQPLPDDDLPRLRVVLFAFPSGRFFVDLMMCS